MALNRGQSWLTYVTNDNLVTNAVVLAESLRRVRTTRRICVITCDNVSADKRMILRKIFDHVFYMDAYSGFYGRGKPDQDGGLQAKIFAFSLRIFDKCIFLGFNTTVMENVDKLFEGKDELFRNLSKAGSSNMFLFTPNLQLCEYLENANWKGNDFSKMISIWMENNLPYKVKNAENFEIKQIPRVSVMDFSLKNGRLQVRNEECWGQPEIVQFVDMDENENKETQLESKLKGFMKRKDTLGLTETTIIKTWLEIHNTAKMVLDDPAKRSLNPAAEYEKQLYENEPIAIIGMSCRFPGANTLDEFWDLMYEGKEAVQKPPAFRWMKDQVIYPSTEKERSTNAGFLSNPVDEFDAKFFGVSPKDAALLDPQARLLHEVLWEGLENSGIDPQSLQGSHTGIFAGSWMNDYKDIIQASTERDFFRTYMGNSIGATAARLSYLLGLTGPSIATESGCSSAIVALDLAVKSLRNGESHLALAGGVNLLLHPFQSNIIDYVIAPDGRCKTFDEKADGFGRAEGCGVLVLKRLSDALRDKDNIWAMIRGSAVSQEGLSRSLGTPTVHCEALAMELALKDAGVSPEQVSFVETHGTGTSVGDPMEVAAIAKAYNSPSRKEPLIIGSVKTNVGHTESCSGITGIIKTVLAMQHDLIPKHLNLERLNPQVNLEAIPAIIPMDNIPWPKIEGKPRFAGVSSFGITGTDGHVILEEAPDFKLPKFDVGLERPLHLIKFSGKTDQALDELLKLYEESFRKKANADSNTADFANAAYTANTGRATFGHCAFLLSSGYEEAANALEGNKVIRGETTSSESPGKIYCFLFTGQGSQYSGMAKLLYETSPVFRFYFDQCNLTLSGLFNLSLCKALWKNESKDKDLSRTIYSQTSIFVIEYCLLKLWESWGIKPDYVLGHSLGEFCAAVAAGILTFEDALMLVAERSRLIDNLPRGSMLVIKASQPEVEQLMKQNHIDLDFAAINAPDQTVVAGDTGIIENLLKICKEKGLKAVILEATHAFHSRHMDSMLENYRKVAKSVKASKNLKCQYISGMEGKLLKDPASQINADYWVRHTREKVSFMNACKVLKQLECKDYLELGPQPVLSTFIIQNIEDSPVSCYPSLRRNTNDWETILTSLGKLYLKGYQIGWEGYDRPYIRQKVSTLPFHPFNRKSFWVECRLKEAHKIHPLIGSAIANASTQGIFENDVSIKSAPYLKDHCIGNMTVFPGAGFTEMCLSAGYCVANVLSETIEKPRRPIALENVRIEAPLELKEGKSRRLQTIVKLQEGEPDAYAGYQCKVFHQNQNEDVDNGNSSSSRNWVPHTSATFYPFVRNASFKETWNPERIIEMIAKEPNSMDGFYKTVDGVGLKFGEQFRTLKRHWFISQENGMDEIVAEMKIPEDHDKYLLHPLIIDAMIQTGLLSGWRSQSEVLRVPVGIGRLALLNTYSENDGTLYLHAKWEDGAKCRVFLATKTLEVLAMLEGIEVIETNVKTIQSVLAQQTSDIPDSWEEVWKPIPGPLDNRVELSSLEPVFALKDFQQRIKAVDEKNSTPEDAEHLRKMNRLVYLYALKALFQLGWKPEQGETITLKEFCKKYKILPNLCQLVHFYFCMFQEEQGLLEIKADNQNGKITWHVVSVTSGCTEQLDIEVAALFDELKEIKRISSVVKIYQYLGSMLAQVLTGEKSILPILFPEEGQQGQHDISAEMYYQNHPGRLESLEKGVEILNTVWRHLNSLNTDKKKVYRVLEVGAGTGSMSMTTVALLAGIWGTQFEYYFTDVSPVFFGKAEKKLSEFPGTLKFQTFNIEEPPLEQGIPLNYFDMVLASDVLHVTKNLKDCLWNLRQTMKPQGHLFFTDTFSEDRGITFVFGLLDGYWRFEDFETRPHHTCVNGETWRKLVLQTGFDFAYVTEVYLGVMGSVTAGASDISGYDIVADAKRLASSDAKEWVVFSPGADLNLKKVASVLRASGCHVRMVLPSPEMDEQTEEEISMGVNSALAAAGQNLQGIIYAWAIDTKVTDQRRIAMPFMHIAKYALEMKKPPKVYVLTRDVHSILETHVNFNPSGATLFGMTKSLKNEYAELFARYVDLDGEREGMTEMVDQILYELAMNKETKERERVQVAYREGLRYEPRFNKAGLPKNPARDDLQLPPSTERYQLVLPESRTINDLSFDVSEEWTVGDDEVEVQTKAYALNFRDLFSILKPTPEFENEKSVGLDFAGVVVRVGSNVTTDQLKVGDRVFGLKIKQIPLPSHVVMPAQNLVKLPENMTFAEAATLPAVFATSYHCLITVAKMKAGDTVLIHTGSGGVGLSAIQLAKHVGVNIITTAGSPRKRAYLKSLGIEHVFHSRNTSYHEDIMRVTNGRGVDIVLNSITGPGFKEATLEACAKNARFVEMSKLSVWTEDEVRERRPDVEYSIVDLTKLEKSVWIDILDSLRTYLKDGHVAPIPYVQFDALRLRQALQYFQKAKHIGKIVVKMPEIKTVDGQWTAHVPLFNSDSTYVITGGLGGIGFEVCKWMLERGATDIVLIGRNPPKQNIAQEIERLNQKGNNIMVKLGDVGDSERIKAMFKEITANCKPVRGIQHCAGVLRDNLYANQTWESFMSAYNPKINGTWNLDRLTRHLPLEHFILYSSITALMGTPSQANHSSANCFEDAFAHYRYSLGLPATTVNWGQWSQVGCAKEVNVTGVLPVSVKRMLNGLEEVLRSQRLQVAFGEFESLGAWNLVCPSFKYYLNEKLQRSMKEGQGQIAQVLLKTDQFWQEMDEAEGKQEKMEVVMIYMKAILRAALRMDADEPINDDANMKDLGVDSLMLIELKNTIQSLLGSRLNVSANMLKDCNTIKDLSTCIVNRLYDDFDKNSQSDTQLSTEELLELLKNDCILNESVQPPTPPIKNIKGIKRVLVTGCTGQLGPYVISWLSQNANCLEKIVCLIRTKDGQCPRKKFKNILDSMNLSKYVDLSKVECVRGNLVLPNFGLDTKSYSDLCSSVDCVIHLAAKSNHVEMYRKSGKGLEGTDVRSVNVGGTLNVLRFASTTKTKHIYHASSILCVFGGGDDPTSLSDQWPELDEMKVAIENRFTGYPISKYVSEMLLKQAVERGIPCKAFRFPWIMGDSQTGQLNYTSNHYILRFLSYLKIKALPMAPLPAIVLPVDICADLSMKVFWSEEAPNEVYNIAHPSPQLEVEFVDAAKQDFGVNLELVEWQSKEFMDKLYGKGMPLESLKDIYEDVERTVSVTSSGTFRAIQGYLTFPERYFRNEKVASIVPDFARNIPTTMDIIRRNLGYVKQTGYTEKFGL